MKELIYVSTMCWYSQVNVQCSVLHADIHLVDNLWSRCIVRRKMWDNIYFLRGHFKSTELHS